MEVGNIFGGHVLEDSPAKPLHEELLSGCTKHRGPAQYKPGSGHDRPADDTKDGTPHKKALGRVVRAFRADANRQNVGRVIRTAPACHSTAPIRATVVGHAHPWIALVSPAIIRSA